MGSSVEQFRSRRVIPPFLQSFVMTTITFGRTPTRDPLTSVAAWACVASGVLMIVAGIPLAPLQAQSPPPTVIALSNMIIHLLQMAGGVGLVTLHAMGAGRVA